MHQLSGLDATFLYLESPQAPMHVGGIYIFGDSSGTDYPDFQAFRAHVAARLDVARTFRQRLVRVPLNLDHPYWIEDPDFDLDAHLSYQALAQPGNWETLMMLAEQFFRRPLDRERPLWEMTFVEGLDSLEEGMGASIALIVKVHHAAVDGFSGEEMIWALLDPKPAPSEHHKAKPWQPAPRPSRLELLTRTVVRTLEQPLTLAKLAGQMAASTVRLVKETILHHVPLPVLPLTAPTTRFNGLVTSNRTLRAVVLPLHKIQAIRKMTEGATVNDVVLAICAGALRCYLDVQRELPEKPLIAAVPISIRSPDNWQDMGNRVISMLVSLATDERDPRKRFQLIHDSALRSKGDFQALGLDRISDLIPSTLTPLIGRIYTGLGVARWLRPVFNLFITNVPGPRQPLYLGNARLLYHLGMAPIFDGLGLILVATSYLDTLVISATSCQEIIPDLDAFIHHLQESFAELETLAVA